MICLHSSAIHDVLMISAGILESPRAVEYLEGNRKAKFDYAFQLAGGDESEIANLVNEAAANVQLALSRVHHYKKSEDVQRSVKRLGD